MQACLWQDDDHCTHGQQRTPIESPMTSNERPVRNEDLASRYLPKQGLRSSQLCTCASSIRLCLPSPALTVNFEVVQQYFPHRRFQTISSGVLRLLCPGLALLTSA